MKKPETSNSNPLEVSLKEPEGEAEEEKVAKEKTVYCPVCGAKIHLVINHAEGK